MEKDNKILLGAVLILLVAMLSFNFNSLTGKVTSKEGSDASISVSPTNVYFTREDLYRGTAKLVTVEVNVKDGEIENKLDLYEGNSKIGSQSRKICGGRASYCNAASKPYQVTFSFDVDDATQEGRMYHFRAESDRGLLKGSGYSKATFASNPVKVSKWVEHEVNYQG